MSLGEGGKANDNVTATLKKRKISKDAYMCRPFVLGIVVGGILGERRGEESHYGGKNHIDPLRGRKDRSLVSMA